MLDTLISEDPSAFFKKINPIDTSFEKGSRVYFYAPQSVGGILPKSCQVLSNFYDLEFKAKAGSLEISPGEFNIPNWGALYEVKPWTNHSTKESIRVPDEGPFVLNINPGFVWRSGCPRSFVKANIASHVAVDLDDNGPHLFLLNSLPVGSEQLVEIESDAPLPSEFCTELNYWLNKIDLSYSALDPQSSIFDISPFPEEISEYSYPIIGQKETSIALPNLFSEKDCDTLVELHVSCPPGMVIPIEGMSLSIQDHIIPVCATDIDSGTIISFFYPRNILPASDEVQLDLHPIQTSSPSESKNVHLQGAVIRPVVREPLHEIILGANSESNYYGRGFYSREFFGDSIPVRWTSSQTELHIYGLNENRPRVLSLVYSDDRPRSAPDADLLVLINGEEMENVKIRRWPNGPLKLWEAEIPPELWQPGIQNLQFICQPFSPKDYSESLDSRQLGIMLHKVIVETIFP